jgi:putative redox protein
MRAGVEQVRIVNGSGVTLDGALHHPPARRTATALVAHSFAAGKALKSVKRICSGLADRGIAALRFDFTGVGRSGGDFAQTTFRSMIEDVLAVVRFLRESGASPGMLIGHSMGGAAVLSAAARLAPMRLVCSIAAPSETASFAETLRARAPQIEGDETAEIELLGKRVRIGLPLLKDLVRHDLLSSVRSLPTPALFLHAPQDEVVPYDSALQLFAAAPAPKGLVTLRARDHLLVADERDAAFAVERIAGFALDTWAFGGGF